MFTRCRRRRSGLGSDDKISDRVLHPLGGWGAIVFKPVERWSYLDCIETVQVYVVILKLLRQASGYIVNKYRLFEHLARSLRE